MSETKDSTTVTSEAPATEAPKIELAATDIQTSDAAPQAAVAEAPAPVFSFADRVKAMSERLRPSARIKFAASIAAALLAGASFGALATTGYGNLQPVPPPRVAVDSEGLKTMLSQIGAEVATIKAGLDTTARSANAQFVKITERIDRVEKAQAEPVAKLARINDAIERIEKRPPAPIPSAAPFTTAAAASPDITGSVVPKQQQRPAVVEGWVLRDIFDGMALVEGPRGLREVGPGSTIPGVGRVEQIRRQDGRWVVVTSSGMIVSR
jgi:hypothetical protein